MRFVDPKSAEYQVRAVLFRVRQKVIAKRIERMNALRSLLYKFGFIASVDLQHLPNWSGKMCCGRTPIETMVDGKEIWQEKYVN